MDCTSIIGTIAATLTTASFIPQVIQVVKTKQTRDISLSMFITFTIGVLGWLIYGILLNAMPIIIANLVVFVLTMIIIVYKLRYR
ncbi:MAG: hypothetical protein A2Y25_09700 [Candidatus Melainabacteria bacterium GWF2_37_15]|nr:MAG: hypothetical protein A2Y25_09700 [Candidatus Melainabacteria bacterium GWF2_37_15]